MNRRVFVMIKKDSPSQSEMFVDAEERVSVPCGHSKQDDLPSFGWYVPVGQGKQGTKPDMEA